jgi:hypothetical protein
VLHQAGHDLGTDAVLLPAFLDRHRAAGFFHGRD